MKEILVIRHAKSSWDHFNLSDKQRPLNDRGDRDAPKMAEFCKKKPLSLSHLISSPAVRAYSTAEYFRDAYADTGIKLWKESNLYHGYEEDWMEVINGLDESIVFPAIFGHNPGLTDLVNRFEGVFIKNVPTCGIVHLKSKADIWTDFQFDNTAIVSFNYPKSIE